LSLSPRILTIIFVVTFLSCNNKKQGKEIPGTNNTSQSKNIIHCVGSDENSKDCNCPAQFNLSDSGQLTHIKDQFYKSASGHLYEKTWSQRQLKEQDTLSWVLYFNGYFSQEVDPLSFEPLNGWYAKDKKNIYYYRPVSGGMQIWKLDKADRNTFTMLAGHYKYAADKNFFYNEADIIDRFLPAKTKLILDKKGRATAMTCNKKTYTFELVN
jgi:hypothetical protein